MIWNYNHKILVIRYVLFVESFNPTLRRAENPAEQKKNGQEVHREPHLPLSASKSL